MTSLHRLIWAALFVTCWALPVGFPVRAQEAKDQVLQPGKFPPPNTGTYLAGELVIIDPVNRRGGLRLDGNEPHDRYHSGPLHYFAMLPYGTISSNGAPAELRDI